MAATGHHLTREKLNWAVDRNLRCAIYLSGIRSSCIKFAGDDFKMSAKAASTLGKPDDFSAFGYRSSNENATSFQLLYAGPNVSGETLGSALRARDPRPNWADPQVAEPAKSSGPACPRRPLFPTKPPILRRIAPIQDLLQATGVLCRDTEVLLHELRQDRKHV